MLVLDRDDAARRRLCASTGAACCGGPKGPSARHLPPLDLCAASATHLNPEALARPAHDNSTQATYEKRKRSLMRKAMELAVMCNSQVALVMFDDKGRLTQVGHAAGSPAALTGVYC